MKLTAFEIKNFIGVRLVSVNFDTPIQLFAGKNGSGKSSLQEAIRMAMLGTSERVIHKKDYIKLVTEGQKVGVSTVDTTQGSGVITIPKGTHNSTLDVNPALQYVLDPSRFAMLGEKERRAFLFGVMGISMSPKEIEKRLLAKELNPEKIELTRPLLRGGFEAARQDTEKNATASKGAWKATTGEAYGEIKAVGWEAPIPETNVDETTLEQTQSALEQAEKTLGEAQQKLGVLQGQASSPISEAQLKILTEQAGTLKEIEANLEFYRNEENEWNRGITALEASKGEACECPSCNASLFFHEGTLKVRDAEQKDDTDKAEEIAGYKKSRDQTSGAIKQLEESRSKALFAQEQLDQISKEKDSDSNKEQLEQAEKEVSTALAAKKTEQKNLDFIRESLRAVEEAQKKTTDAASHHQDVVEWTAIAEALSPNGIPGDILAEALKPFNEILTENSTLAEWEKVTIADDMNLLFGGRVYGLLCESEKWRVDTQIALAIAQTSGLNLVMLDRVDVLDLPNRIQLVKMLNTLARSNKLESAILCGTFKEKPKVPPEITAYWLENGELK